MPGVKMRVAIIDDEPPARAALRRMLVAYGEEIAVTGEADGVAAGLKLLQRERVDLLLLDVEMEDGTGFDLLDRIGQIDFHVVFTTAHDDFAIRAFRYNAIDYLLKPIVAEELAYAVEKVCRQADLSHHQAQLTALLNTASQKQFERIVLPAASGPVFVQVEHIIRIETYGNYCFVYMISGERHLAARNLKEFEEILPALQFFRPHQSHLVQTRLVKQLQRTDEGYFAVMCDQSRVPVARRRKEAFEAILKGPAL